MCFCLSRHDCQTTVYSEKTAGGRGSLLDWPVNEGSVEACVSGGFSEMAVVGFVYGINGVEVEGAIAAVSVLTPGSFSEFTAGDVMFASCSFL